MTLDYYAYQNQKSTIDSAACRGQELHIAYLLKEARGLKNKEKNKIRDCWQKSLSVKDDPWEGNPFDFCQMPDSLAFTLDTSAIEWLPQFSFVLQLPFKIDKPYISKDEKSIYILENPLRREKIFKTPMLAATGWKGALRAVMVQMLVQWWKQLDESEKKKRNNCKQFVSWRLQLVRLFGTERGADMDDENYNNYLDKLGGKYQSSWFRRYLRRFISPSGSIVGRLQFYPTFFKETALEIINPHDCKTGTSMRGPILLECVPENAEGIFSIVYVPFGPFGMYKKIHKEAVAQDLIFLAKGIRAMLTVYGFGAKTSSGFGKAKERLAGEGRLLLKSALSLKDLESDAESQRSEELPRYLETADRLIEELRRSDGTLKEEDEYRQWLENNKLKYNKKRKQLYSKAKLWWERKQLEENSLQDVASEPEPSAKKEPFITEITFNTLDEFYNQVQRLATALRKGGAM